MMFLWGTSDRFKFGYEVTGCGVEFYFGWLAFAVLWCRDHIKHMIERIESQK